MKTFFKILGGLLVYNYVRNDNRRPHDVGIRRNCAPYEIPNNDVNGPYNSI